MLEFDGKSISEIATEYANFFWNSDEGLECADIENSGFDDYIYPILHQINDDLLFPTKGRVATAVWWYDLFKFLNESAPKAIRQRFSQQWAEMVAVDIDKLAVEYANFYLSRGIEYNLNSKENIVFLDRINPILIQINNQFNVNSEGQVGSPVWWYDLYICLNKTAPAEIQERFRWCWTDISNRGGKKGFRKRTAPEKLVTGDSPS